MKLLCWLSTVLFLPIFTPPSPPEPPLLPPGIYAVLGVFEHANNAMQFAQYAQSQAIDAQYGYHPGRHYYYVYAYASSSVAQTVEKCLQLRQKPNFKDAWVLNTTPTTTPAPVPSSEEAYQVYFQAVDENQQPLPATVKVLREDGAKLIKECRIDTTEQIEHDRLTSPRVQVELYAIGYQKAILPLSLDNPTDASTSAYATLDEAGVIQVRAPLRRLKPGEAQELINTYFYGDAAVLRDKSRDELEALVRYLQAYPTVRIALHGHTNGNERGLVYLYKPEAQNFFDIRRSQEFTKNNVGAVKLSELRAETIKDYLVNEGIAADRIETKGWGGKQMLYEAESAKAKRNIRVEIEVLRE